MIVVFGQFLSMSMSIFGIQSTEETPSIALAIAFCVTVNLFKKPTVRTHDSDNIAPLVREATHTD